MTLYRPAPGVRFRKPDGFLLAEAGEAIQASPYFARAVARGDLVPVPVPASPPAPQPELATRPAGKANRKSANTARNIGSAPA